MWSPFLATALKLAAMFEALEANAVLLGALHTPPKMQHTAVPFNGAPI